MTELGTSVVHVRQAPGDEGTAYTLTLPDGRQAVLSETGDHYAQLAHIIDVAFGDAEPEPSHPEHTECVDGCGLDVDHNGACLDRPGGRQVCFHVDLEEYVETYCGCGFKIVWTPEGWQHCDAPWFWGDDHSPRGDAIASQHARLWQEAYEKENGE